MSTTYDRLIATAERLAFQAQGLLDAGRFRPAEIQALGAVGILMFLVVDEATPEEMRPVAETKAHLMRSLGARARKAWLEIRLKSKMSGPKKDYDDPELDEALEDMEYVMRSVQEEFRGR